MVEYNYSIDLGFGSLADPIRRDILERVSICELSVSELASEYDVSFAAVSKHIKVLEQAKLVTKRRDGKHVYIGLSPAPLTNLADYLSHYSSLTNARFDALEHYLSQEKEKL